MTATATPREPKETKDLKDPGETREPLDFTASNKPVDRSNADCAWVGVYATSAGAELSPSARVVDKVSDGAIAKLLKAGDFDAKLGNCFLVRDLPGLGVSRVLLVGLGKKEAFKEKSFSDAVRAATKAMAGLKGVKRVSTYLTELTIEGTDGEWRAQTHVLAMREALYRFERFKTRKEGQVEDKPAAAKTPKAAKADQPALKEVEMLLPGDMRPTDAPRVLADAVAIANGIELTKDLGNLPPNICTPTHLSVVARGLARQFRMKVEILDRPAMEKLGMNALLAVSAGSAQPPQFIVLQHNGGTAKEAPMVLVGKGITFDTGGISLKPGADMDEMKYDMSGASSVLGVMRAVGEMGLKR
ncbi:MAG: hypothetical protein EBR88_04690, partial [Betaproteobacteria bacterium]|nr:hypothetical protein [Betaproteobacteria bacterium]